LLLDLIGLLFGVLIEPLIELLYGLLLGLLFDLSGVGTLFFLDGLFFLDEGLLILGFSPFFLSFSRTTSFS